MRGNEKCAGANATEPTKVGALVWSDETCTTEAPFMCRVAGEASTRKPSSTCCCFGLLSDVIQI